MADETEAKAVWTPLKIIQWAVPFLTQKGLPNPRLDAEILIAHALQLDRLKVYLQFDRPLDPAELTSIRELLKRRAQHEPIQYITGKREFYGLPFRVAPGVLIPRPETELLVELAVEYLREIPEEERRVLDLGTGSGCIALSIAKTLPCRIWAVDSSLQALEIAQDNGTRLGVQDSVEWRQGDWFSALGPQDPAQFQVILSNPPYIPLGEKDELAPEVRDFEPAEALFGGENGLKAYETLALSLRKRLVPGGLALLELHANGADKVLGFFQGEGWKESLHPDLAGHPRILRLDG